MQDHAGERIRGERDAEATREALLDAGAELFARYGFGGTTVDMIARRARANKAMINYYFGGKEGLYEQILISTFGEAAARVQTVLDAARPADEMLRAFTEMFRDLIAQRPHFPAMMIREAISGGRHLNDRVLPFFLDMFVKVRRIYEQGIEDGTFRPVDPVLTHLVVMGGLLFFFATEPMRARLIADGRLPVAQAPTAGEFIASIQDLMVRGLSAEAPAKTANGTTP
jgi:TetR/AcrR family transcriptional regulator